MPDMPPFFFFLRDKPAGELRALLMKARLQGSVAMDIV